ncbi:hypothetical protein C4B25_00330 [Mycoplasma todarodis]|uniref:Uncharacterized protein n=1 Tax=Mycoplasma todarodis TaxID=1937191 RepID=A0A4R0XVW5_9MOLU|nr:hypothetical protein C4B25_00330 [Mycoplasma todarodis]
MISSYFWYFICFHKFLSGFYCTSTSFDYIFRTFLVNSLFFFFKEFNGCYFFEFFFSFFNVINIEFFFYFILARSWSFSKISNTQRLKCLIIILPLPWNISYCVCRIFICESFFIRISYPNFE